MSARGRKLTAFPSRDGELAETNIGRSMTQADHFCGPAEVFLQVVLLEYVVEEIGQRQISQFSSRSQRSFAVKRLSEAS
ncbi:hypothetical protein LF1_09510 [Rubripirellula obstinata]|uniref:Uncharacterized protein n=1 Tax=Rubripirellula obstinata TaxID=406547 RepID=A0A5B1CE03_9BACT|nr:hypothetical protein LF1_09510 [Rubripirellula obstinata]